MNRFLYAEGNPWSMVDPSGHASSYEGGGCGPGGKYCGSTGNDQNWHKNYKQVNKQGNPHNRDVKQVGPQWTPQSTPTVGTEVTGTCMGSACGSNSNGTSSGNDGAGATQVDHGTPPSENDMWDAYVSCAMGASHMSSMLICMEGQLGSPYWAVVAFGRNYDGKFDGLPAWATATEIVAALEAGRVGYLGAIANVAVAQELSPGDAELIIEAGTRVGSGQKTDTQHLFPAFNTSSIGTSGSVFRIASNDGGVRFLVQVPAIGGRDEWIIDLEGNITHERFISGGTINGLVNDP